MPKINLDIIEQLSAREVQEMLEALTPKLNKYIPHIPTPKQTVFMNAEDREMFFGGAAGGGKSDALLMDALQNVDKQGYAAILFRRSFADLVKPGALIDRAKEWLSPYMQSGEVRWVDKEKKFEFLEGDGRYKKTISTLQFGYLETEKDKYNYQGGEYQYIGFDEVVHMSETNYRYMFSRLRKLKGMDVPLKVRSASNPPDDAQGQWVYNRFVNPETKKESTIFIPAGMDDNPHLDVEEYEKSLEELDPVTRARLRDGVWTIKRTGNMFKREWFEMVDRVPAQRRIVRFWDMASTDPNKDKKRKTTGDPDYTVGFKISEYMGVYYIEDIEAVRVSPQETERIQKRTALTDGYRVAIREEQEPGSSGVTLISIKARSYFKGYDYKGIRSSGSKVLRANAVSSAAERGDIKILRGCRNLDLFFDQVESFPSKYVHDDCVDGLSGGFNQLQELPDYGITPIEVGDDESSSYWESDLSNVIQLGNTAGYFGGI